MKKIFAFILCAMLIMALPIVASADEGEATEGANVPPVEETLTEGENEPSMTDTIVSYVKDHLEEILVIVFMSLFSFYEAVVRGKTNGSIGVLNNNAISIAENSAKAIKDALKEVEDIAGVVKNYKEEFETLLGEVRKSAEEKQSLEETLGQVMTFLKTAKMANLELSEEVSELLTLANIPNSVKEKLVARHHKAVRELEATEEVMNSDRAEA